MWWGPEGFRYYGLDGQPITETEREALGSDPARFRIALDVLTREDGVVLSVSTVFLGWQTLYGTDPELKMQFETAVWRGEFDSEDSTMADLPVWRWPDRQAAEEGHRQILRLAGIPGVVERLEAVYRKHEQLLMEGRTPAM